MGMAALLVSGLGSCPVHGEEVSPPVIVPSPEGERQAPSLGVSRSSTAATVSAAPVTTAPTTPASSAETEVRTDVPPRPDVEPTVGNPNAASSTETSGIVSLFGLALHQYASYESAAAGLTAMVNPFGMVADLTFHSLEAYQKAPAFVRRAQISLSLPVSETALAGGTAPVGQLGIQVKAELLGKTDPRSAMWNKAFEKAAKEKASPLILPIQAKAEQEISALFQRKVELEMEKEGLEKNPHPSPSPLPGPALGTPASAAPSPASGEDRKGAIDKELAELDKKYEAAVATRDASLKQAYTAAFKELAETILKGNEIFCTGGLSIRFVDPVTLEKKRGAVGSFGCGGQFPLTSTNPLELTFSAAVNHSPEFPTERSFTAGGGFLMELGRDRLPMGPLGLGMQISTLIRPEPPEGTEPVTLNLTEVIRLPLQTDKFLQVSVTETLGTGEVGFNLGYTWVPRSQGGIATPAGTTSPQAAPATPASTTTTATPPTSP